MLVMVLQKATSASKAGKLPAKNGHEAMGHIHERLLAV